MYDLLNVPDDQLTQEEVAIKKRQYILKKAREGREKAQAKQREKRQKVKQACRHLCNPLRANHDCSRRQILRHLS